MIELIETSGAGLETVDDFATACIPTSFPAKFGTGEEGPTVSFSLLLVFCARTPPIDCVVRSATYRRKDDRFL